MHLCISVRWLDDRYHGQIQEGIPEWPPSPLRLYQALLAAAGKFGAVAGQLLDALLWLEKLCNAPPTIVSPDVVHGRPFLRYVPNNDADKKPHRKDRLSDKVVVPTYLRGRRTIHYAWKLEQSEIPAWRSHRRTVIELSRRIATFGWGVDMAVGKAHILSARRLAWLMGEPWLPVRVEAQTGLRVPVTGTLQDIQRRHQQFVERIGPDGLRPPEPLTTFRVVEYRRASDPAPRSVACFTLMRRDGGFRAFDPPRNTIRVAGMVRCAAKSAAEITGGWPDPASFVLGHGEKPGDKHQSVNNRRFAYLPLPSIQPHRPGRAPAVGSIRRVCVTVFEQAHEAEVEWARRTLPGADLVRKETGEIAALLAPAAQTDTVLRPYLDPASNWASVSPVVLPGYDDPRHYRKRLAAPDIGLQEQRRLLDALYHRVEKLLRKAIRDAGFPHELALHADLDWREGGFWPGTEKACNYMVPNHLTRFPRLHVRLRWRDALGNPVVVPGPICLGGGRFYGLGLFAAMEPDI